MVSSVIKMKIAKIIVPMVFLILAVSSIPVVPVKADSSDLWAVVVGVEGGGATHLDNDAQDFENVLQNVYGYQSSNIKLLINSQGTKAAVLSALEWVGNQAVNTSSAVVIFFSTHGSNDVLYLYDDTLTENELFNSLSTLESHNILVVINACKSGSFIDLADAFPTGIVVTASAADELTYDIDNFENTVFVEYFVDRGMSQGLADANSDGVVTVEEAFVYAEAKCNPPPGPLIIPRTHPQIVDNYEEEFELSNPIHAPWFTNLAMVMLATTAVYYLKKKRSASSPV
jgi:hypothetical protein